MRRLLVTALGLVGFVVGCDTPTRDGRERECLETRQPAPPGAADAALTLVSMPLRAPLAWGDGRRTEIVFTFQSAQAFQVSSRRNPDYTLDIEVDCRDHLVLVGNASLRTEDGGFNEAWSSGELKTNERGGAHLVHTVKAKDLRGTYRRAVQAGQCFEAVQFNVDVGSPGFSGTTTDTVLNAPCGNRDATTGVGAAPLAVRWPAN